MKLLCDSGVAKYCEFKCVDRFLGCSGSNEGSSGSISLSVVPCSRAEIYQTDAISFVHYSLFRCLIHSERMLNSLTFTSYYNHKQP